MNIKEFLLNHKIDYTLYDLSTIKIEDILIFDKEISQTVTQELRQYKDQYWEWLQENKKELTRNHLFLKNDFPVWTHIIRAIEPDTLTYDDCKTCDWHWTIICTNCWGKWEVICPKCWWKTILINEIKKQRVHSISCQNCGWKWSFSQSCKKCWGTWSIRTFERCSSCFWRWTINQNWQIQPCQQCRWMWKIERTQSCPICQWKGTLTQNCQKCMWKWTIQQVENYIEKEIFPCNTCKQSWRVPCRVCWWNQEITCPTCHWERKTHQLYLNIFNVTVSDKKVTLLSSSKLSDDYYKTIVLEPSSIVKTLTEIEKEELIKYSQKNNIKINPKTISRLKWLLYKLTNKNTWENYYIWFSNIRNQYYFNELPPKNNLEEKLNQILKVFTRYFTKSYLFLRNLWDKLTNKKRY